MNIIANTQQESNRNYQTRRRLKLGTQTRDIIRRNNELVFIQKSQEVHKNKYNYSLVEYHTKRTKVQLICPHHSIFTQSPDAHQRGQGCPKCAHERRIKSRKRKTTHQFIKEANNKHNNKYDYTNTEYTNIKSKVNICCVAHGEFYQEAKAHLRGQGCPDCANEKRASFFESEGERLIEAFLLQNVIQYEKQKTFDECRHKMLLRYDFYLPKYNVLIEFDGQQHYEFVPRFHGTLEGFKLYRLRDEIKTEYALNNNIGLLRIRWDEQNNVSSILEETLL